MLPGGGFGFLSFLAQRGLSFGFNSGSLWWDLLAEGRVVRFFLRKKVLQKYIILKKCRDQFLASYPLLSFPTNSYQDSALYYRMPYKIIRVLYHILVLQCYSVLIDEDHKKCSILLSILVFPPPTSTHPAAVVVDVSRAETARDRGVQPEVLGFEPGNVGGFGSRIFVDIIIVSKYPIGLQLVDLLSIFRKVAISFFDKHYSGLLKLLPVLFNLLMNIFLPAYLILINAFMLSSCYFLHFLINIMIIWFFGSLKRLHVLLVLVDRREVGPLIATSGVPATSGVASVGGGITASGAGITTTPSSSALIVLLVPVRGGICIIFSLSIFSWCRYEVESAFLYIVDFIGKLDFIARKWNFCLFVAFIEKAIPIRGADTLLYVLSVPPLTSPLQKVLVGTLLFWLFCCCSILVRSGASSK
jgi:hypothetical protein